MPLPKARRGSESGTRESRRSRPSLGLAAGPSTDRDESVYTLRCRSSKAASCRSPLAFGHSVIAWKISAVAAVAADSRHGVPAGPTVPRHNAARASCAITAGSVDGAFMRFVAAINSSCGWHVCNRVLRALARLFSDPVWKDFLDSRRDLSSILR